MSVSTLSDRFGLPGMGFAGLTIGLVTDVKDPDNLGRVKLQLPLLGSEITSDWVRVASFFAGGGFGAFFQPKVGAEVLVGFLQGNPNMPYVVGSLWNGVDKPPVEAGKQQDVDQIRTKGGLVLTFDDSESGQSISLTDPKQNKLVIDTKNNKITIFSNQTMEITAQGGSLTLTGESVTIKATSSAKIEAESINLTASGVLTLRGEMINLN